MIRIALTVLLLVFAQPSLAQDPVQRVRALLDAGDIDGLERTLRTLHDAQRGGESASTLREINARLFETIHPERGAAIRRWQEGNPQSVYAATAAAWQAIKLFEAAGSLTERYQTPVSPAGLATYDEAKERARVTTEKALDLADDYAPAFDAWFRLRVGYPKRDDLVEMAEALMSVAPEAESIRVIVAGAQHWSPHPGRDALGICLAYATRASDYDVDRCVIEAAIPNAVGGDLGSRAADVLRGMDDPALDWAHLQQAVWASSPDNWDLDRIETWYRRMPLSNTDLNWYVTTGRRIAAVGKRPDVLIEGSNRALDEIAVRISDNPLDPSLRALEAALHLERYLRGHEAGNLALARKAWEAGVVHGGNSADYWQAGSLLATADKEPWDVADAVAFHENAIAYSGQSVATIVFAFFWLDEARLAAEAAGNAPGAGDIHERLQCPMLRMARLADALCRSDPAAAMFCDPAQPPFSHGPEVLAAGAQTCPDVASARLSSLKFKPVPHANVPLPWK
ncbi:MAG: hypothetical protein WBA90_05515 [Albidovulum sp.]